MDKRTELINILKAELTLLSNEILQNIDQKDLNDLYKSSRKLYEKMAAIHVLNKTSNTPEDFIGLLSNQEETLVNHNISKPKVQEQSPQEEKPLTTSEKTTKVAGENPYKQEIKFVPKQKKSYTAEAASKTPVSDIVSTKKMSIGLNDKIAFIKNLFNGDADAYHQVVEYLNATNDYEEALKYIYQSVKPRYNNWEGKDEYEFRLIQLLELKFN